jgi:(+)-beta-caryophyllene/(+)-caryolan-1-ol synthase
MKLPVSFMPFNQSGANPAVDQAGAGMREWLEDFGLCPSPAARRSIDRTRPELCVAYYYPALDPENLTLFAQFCAWAFVLDDEFDDGQIGCDPPRCERAINGLLDAFDEAPLAKGSLARAFSNLWSRLTPGRSSSWCQALRADITAWLWTYYGETVDRKSQLLPPISYFREHRRDAVGEPMFLDLAELAAGADLPEPVRRLLSIQEMKNAAAEQMGLYNDRAAWEGTSAPCRLASPGLPASRGDLPLAGT